MAMGTLILRGITDITWFWILRIMLALLVVQVGPFVWPGETANRPAEGSGGSGS